MRTFILFILFGCTFLSAQEKARGLQVRFVAQHLPKGLPEVVAASEEETSEAFKIPKNNLSERFKVPAREFVLQTASPVKPLSKVTLPEAGSDFIVLLVPGEDTVFRAIVLNSKNAAFRPGNFYLLNTSKETIVGKIGTTQCMLKPGEGEVVSPAGARDERFYDVLLGIRDGQNSARPISSSRWPLSKRTRTYVFFFNDVSGKSVDFRAVDEFVPEEQ